MPRLVLFCLARCLGTAGPVVALACPAVAWAAPSAEVSIVHHFSARESEGRSPQAALLVASDGWLYGTTPVGGKANQGTTFRLRPDGSKFETLHHFTKRIGDGGASVGALLQIDDRFYGQSEAGGDAGVGTIYRMAADGSQFELLHSFDLTADGTGPTSGLIDGHNGLLYGTTDFGGTYGQGTVFAIAPTGDSYYTLHHFRNVFGDGGKPQAALLQTPDGALLGTTSGGGNHGRGSLFRLKPDGTDFQVVHNFAGGHVDGQTPLGALIQDESGNVFGATRAGGTPAQGGAVFKVKPDGAEYQMLRGFTGLNGEPGALGNGLVFVDANWLLGTSLRGGQNNKGTVFVLSKDGKEMTVVHYFSGPPQDGLVPLSPLVKVGERTFYGTTERGGSEDAGTIYRVVLRFD